MGRIELPDEGSSNFDCWQIVGTEKRWHECLGQFLHSHRLGGIHSLAGGKQGKCFLALDYLCPGIGKYYNGCNEAFIAAIS